MKTEQTPKRTLNRRKFLQLSSTAAGLALLSACAAPAAQPGESAVPDREQICCVTRTGATKTRRLRPGAPAGLHGAEPNICVEQMYIPEAGDPYLQKMNAMAASNTLPEAPSSPTPISQLGLADMFLDLSRSIPASTRRSTPSIQNAGQAHRQRLQQEIQLIWYNKDLFDEEGIPYPPASAEEAWSWDQSLEFAKQLTVDINGNNALSAAFDPTSLDRFGFQIGLSDMPVITYMRSNGGDIFNEDWTGLTLDAPQSVEAIQMMADLMNVHSVMPKLTAGGTMSTDSGLLSRKIAMAMDGQWVLETLNRVRREEGLNFGIGVLPYIQDKVTTATGGPIIAFSASQHPAEAMQLVSFIMDPANTPDYITGGLWMPNEKRWYHEPELLSIWIDNENHPPEYKSAVVDYSLDYVTRPLPIYRLPNWPGMWQILNPALEQVWLGEKTAEEAIAGVMPQASAYFDAEIAPLMI